MQDALRERWWAVALRGGVAGLFGLVALLTPGLTLGFLESLFGLYALADGALALWLGWPTRTPRPGARLLLVEGGVGTGVGVIALLWPGITAFVLLLFVAVRAMAIGGLQIAESAARRRAGQHDRLLDVAGLVSLLFGGALLVLPSVAARGTLWWLALHALVVAALLGTLGVRLRAAAHGSSSSDGMVAAM